MATVTGAVRRPSFATVVKPRRRQSVFVGAGDDVFLVSEQAVRETEYPLLGVRHTVIQVPNPMMEQEQRAWLALEQRISCTHWRMVWQRCQAEKPHFFQPYTVVTLAQPSRSLPAGNVVFKSMTDIIRIPLSELQYLPVRDRHCVERAYAEAVMNLPSQKPLHFLQPVYVNAEKATRLATPKDVMHLAQQRQDALQEFCRKRGRSVALHESDDHLSAARSAWEKETKEINRRRVLAFRQKRPVRLRQEIAPGLQRLTHEYRRFLADRIRRNRPTILERFSRQLERPVKNTAMQLGLIDPIIAFEEPSWKLPLYGDDVKVLRTVVHWDDQGVTLLH